MRALMVYDSAFGNTAQVAHSVARELARHYDVQSLLVDETRDVAPEDIDLLVVGSPTQGGRATVAVQEYIKNLPDLNSLPVAVFDTRFSVTGHGIALHLLMKTIGFAAEKMAAELGRKGGKLISPPMGFIVRDKTGPLEDRELERAAAWASGLMQQAQLARHAAR